MTEQTLEFFDDLSGSDDLSEAEAVSAETVCERIATETDAGLRLDVFVALYADVSRSAAAAWIEDGRVTLGGKNATKKDKVKAGATVVWTVPSPEAIEATPQDIPLDVVYEDDDLIVVNKPTGMVVHPAPGNPDGTLVNALLWHCKGSLSGIGGAIRPGIVHRIDKDTSGLLVVAKNDFAHRALSDALKTHDVRRVYTALVLGGFREETGTVDAPIGRHPQDRKRMAVLRGDGVRAREAVTHYTVLEDFSLDGERISLVRCDLETGRTHQIRVHMASIGHPLLGDPVYGGRKSRFETKHPKCFFGQMLHAGTLSFVHPRTGKPVTFSAPLPDYFEAALKLLRGSNASENALEEYDDGKI